MSQIESLPDRAVIRLTGEDRYTFLQGVVTQDVDLLQKQPAIFSALLTPQGKILFDFFVVTDGDALLIDCNADAAPTLLKRLSMYKLRAKVSLAVDPALRIIASDAEISNGLAFPDPREPSLGWRAIISDEDVAPDGDYDRRRIALGIPEFGKDFGSDEVFLTDVNYDMLNGVSYKKGCFIGQEVTSRIKRKGEIRRRSLIAEFHGAAPEKGAAITAGASTLGEILSGGDGCALVQIRMDRLEKAKNDETPIECDGRPLLLRVPAALERG